MAATLKDWDAKLAAVRRRSTMVAADLIGRVVLLSDSEHHEAAIHLSFVLLHELEPNLNQARFLLKATFNTAIRVWGSAISSSKVEGPEWRDTLKTAFSYAKVAFGLARHMMDEDGAVRAARVMAEISADLGAWELVPICSSHFCGRGGRPETFPGNFLMLRCALASSKQELASATANHNININKKRWFRKCLASVSTLEDVKRLLSLVTSLDPDDKELSDEMMAQALERGSEVADGPLETQEILCLSVLASMNRATPGSSLRESLRHLSQYIDLVRNHVSCAQSCRGDDGDDNDARSRHWRFLDMRHLFRLVDFCDAHSQRLMESASLVEQLGGRDLFRKWNGALVFLCQLLLGSQPSHVSSSSAKSSTEGIVANSRELELLTTFKARALMRLIELTRETFGSQEARKVLISNLAASSPSGGSGAEEDRLPEVKHCSLDLADLHARMAMGQQEGCGKDDEEFLAMFFAAFESRGFEDEQRGEIIVEEPLHLARFRQTLLKMLEHFLADKSQWARLAVGVLRSTVSAAMANSSSGFPDYLDWSLLKLLLKVDVMLWLEPQVAGISGDLSAVNNDKDARDLVKTLQAWRKTALLGRHRCPDSDDLSVWVSRVAWNVALETVDLEAKQVLFGVAADLLQLGNPSRLCCRTMELACAFSRMSAADRKSAQNRSGAVDHAVIAKALDDCDAMLKEQGASATGPRTRRLIWVYKVMGLASTGRWDDLEAFLSSLSSAEEMRNDPLLPQLLCATLHSAASNGGRDDDDDPRLPAMTRNMGKTADGRLRRINNKLLMAALASTMSRVDATTEPACGDNDPRSVQAFLQTSIPCCVDLFHGLLMDMREGGRAAKDALNRLENAVALLLKRWPAEQARKLPKPSQDQVATMAVSAWNTSVHICWQRGLGGRGSDTLSSQKLQEVARSLARLAPIHAEHFRKRFDGGK